jgi:hypothetical protein
MLALSNYEDLVCHEYLLKGQVVNQHSIKQIYQTWFIDKEMLTQDGIWVHNDSVQAHTTLSVDDT